MKHNGIAFRKTPAKNILQPFFTNKPNEQGTGLGFSLDYGIRKAHGVKIQASGREGESTEFAASTLM